MFEYTDICDILSIQCCLTFNIIVFITSTKAEVLRSESLSVILSVCRIGNLPISSKLGVMTALLHM